jgi:hypothetical protein
VFLFGCRFRFVYLLREWLHSGDPNLNASGAKQHFLLLNIPGEIREVQPKVLRKVSVRAKWCFFSDSPVWEPH